MRILQIINSTDPAGGGPIEAICQAAKAVEKRGHTMEIACVDAPDSAWLDALPVTTHALGPTVSPYRYSHRLLPWLRRHASAYGCAILNGIWLYPSYGAWKALRPLDVPYFVYTHGLLDPAHKRVFPMRHVKKAVSWLATERRVLDDARAVFFTCERERSAAQRAFWPPQDRDNGVILPYCIAAPPSDEDRQQAAFLSRFGHLKGKRRLLFLSRVHPKKGCDIAIEAFARVSMKDPDLHLIIAGPGDRSYVLHLQRLAAARQVADRITWTGMLTGDMKWGAFRCAELFLLPSHHENFGIAVVEALACSLPVLISEAINIAPTIAADRAGLVCRDDVASVTQALECWWDLTISERACMRQCALDCFRKRYSVDKSCQLLLETLQRHGVGDCDSRTGE